jgi:hypothetical protein
VIGLDASLTFNFRIGTLPYADMVHFSDDEHPVTQWALDCLPFNPFWAPRRGGEFLRTDLRVQKHLCFALQTTHNLVAARSNVTQRFPSQMRQNLLP